MRSQILQASSFSPERNVYIITSVSRLFASCRPFAISRFVISVIVNTFNGHAFRGFSHVVQKIGKIHPSFTNFYSSTTIVFVRFFIWVKASFFNRLPASICFCCSVPFVVVVLVPAFYGLIFLIATAGFCISYAYTRVWGNNKISTITSAFAHGPKIFNWCLPYDGEPCKSSADGNSFTVRHNVVYSMLCLAVGIRLQSNLTATPYHT